MFHHMQVWMHCPAQHCHFLIWLVFYLHLRVHCGACESVGTSSPPLAMGVAFQAQLHQPVLKASSVFIRTFHLSTQCCGQQTSL